VIIIVFVLSTQCGKIVFEKALSVNRTKSSDNQDCPGHCATKYYQDFSGKNRVTNLEDDKNELSKRI
jgi:hypothetical protein